MSRPCREPQVHPSRSRDAAAGHLVGSLLRTRGLSTVTFTAADLAVILPTHKRWPILRRTLAALAAQTVSGFSVTVVVDGRDMEVPEELGAGLDRFARVVQDHAGPGAARNHAVRLTTEPLVLFL